MSFGYSKCGHVFQVLFCDFHDFSCVRRTFVIRNKKHFKLNLPILYMIFDVAKTKKSSCADAIVLLTKFPLIVWFSSIL